MTTFTEDQVLAAVRSGASPAQLFAQFGSNLSALNRAAQLLFLNFNYEGALALVKAGAGAHPLDKMAAAAGLTEFVTQVREVEATFFRERYLANPAAWWEQRNELQLALRNVHTTARAMEGALEAMGFGLILPKTLGE